MSYMRISITWQEIWSWRDLQLQIQKAIYISFILVYGYKDLFELAFVALQQLKR